MAPIDEMRGAMGTTATLMRTAGGGSSMTTAALMLLFAPGHALLAGVTSGRLWPRFGPKMAVLPPYNSGITPIEIQIIQRQFATVRDLPRVSERAGNLTDGEVHDRTWWWSRTQEVDDYIEPTFRRLFTHKDG